jgi:hypothetical protein
MIEFNPKDNVEKQLDCITQFIYDWYGIGKQMEPKSSFQIALPQPLQYIYRYYESVFQRLVTFNHFVKSCDLQNQNGAVTFYIESEGVYIWQIESMECNPEVYISENRKPRYWIQEEERLCGFLFQVLAYEAMMGAKYHCSSSWIDKNRLDEILSKWKPAPFSPWQWPEYPSNFYINEKALAFVFPNREDFTFQCGSNDPLSLNFMKSFIDETWEDNNIEGH